MIFFDYQALTEQLKQRNLSSKENVVYWATTIGIFQLLRLFRPSAVAPNSLLTQLAAYSAIAVFIYGIGRVMMKATTSDYGSNFSSALSALYSVAANRCLLFFIPAFLGARVMQFYFTSEDLNLYVQNGLSAMLIIMSVYSIVIVHKSIAQIDGARQLSPYDAF